MPWSVLTLKWKIWTSHWLKDSSQKKSLFFYFLRYYPDFLSKNEKIRKSFLCDRSENMYLELNNLESSECLSLQAKQIFRHWIDIDTTTCVRLNRSLSKYSTKTALGWWLVIHNCHLHNSVISGRAAEHLPAISSWIRDFSDEGQQTPEGKKDWSTFIDLQPFLLMCLHHESKCTKAKEKHFSFKWFLAEL